MDKPIYVEYSDGRDVSSGYCDHQTKRIPRGTVTKHQTHPCEWYGCALSYCKLCEYGDLLHCPNHSAHIMEFKGYGIVTMVGYPYGNASYIEAERLLDKGHTNVWIVPNIPKS
jgi:hypothetical protein